MPYGPHAQTERHARESAAARRWIEEQLAGYTLLLERWQEEDSRALALETAEAERHWQLAEIERKASGAAEAERQRALAEDDEKRLALREAREAEQAQREAAEAERRADHAAFRRRELAEAAAWSAAMAGYVPWAGGDVEIHRTPREE